MAFVLLLWLLCAVSEHACLVYCNDNAASDLYVYGAGCEVYTAYCSVDATAYHHIVALLECVLELTNLLLLLLLLSLQLPLLRQVSLPQQWLLLPHLLSQQPIREIV